MFRFVFILCVCVYASTIQAATKTWDGRHDTEEIDVQVVYFVPSDRVPLVDWRQRVDYFCRRIELFHRREFQGQSKLSTHVHPEPLISELTTPELRSGDANGIFFRTLRETDRRLQFAKEPTKAFPILLVLSEINWRPLDDFYRGNFQDGKFVFEGNMSNGEHFPGAASGGARATYLAQRRAGWGLVSADGWRVPYRGSDCVIYHEGVGHTVGLPHPEPADGSVMSLAQYRGWINESFIEKNQKSRLGWQPEQVDPDPQLELFSRFRAIPQPVVPKPDQAVQLKLDWPENAKVKSLRVRFQTSVVGPWIEVPQAPTADPPDSANLGEFDRETPVSYRVDAELENGATAELWGYLQVRRDPEKHLQPQPTWDQMVAAKNDHLTIDQPAGKEIDLLEKIDPANCWQIGEWTKKDQKLQSPKRFGARIELPYAPSAEYRLTVIVEPLDEPNGMLLGHRSDENRFVTLFDYAQGESRLSAIENIDGKNIGNETTYAGNLFEKNRLSQVIVIVRKEGVSASVDGRQIIAWRGQGRQLSLSDYWKTPDAKSLMLGAYDCRYRFHRITLEPLP